MGIKQITITGADNSVSITDLVDLSVKYPFVEWGVLLSATRAGTKRYPSYEWIEKYTSIKRLVPMHTSAHICGRWMRSFAEGLLPKSGYGFILDPPIFPYDFLASVDRMQLNLGDTDLKTADRGLLSTIGKAVIIQNNIKAVSIARLWGVNAQLLYDESRGTGQLPNGWRIPYRNYYTGYSGGLGPDNLAEEIPKILKVIMPNNHPAARKETSIWLDMESGVRDDDNNFDLDKVARCLEIAAPFMDYNDPR